LKIYVAPPQETCPEVLPVQPLMKINYLDDVTMALTITLMTRLEKEVNSMADGTRGCIIDMGLEVISI